MSVEKYFPYSSYRKGQREALLEASNSLENYRVIVLDLPTGLGKSGINTTLARESNNSYITTPQVHLREQLENDKDLNSHFTGLAAKSDYTCNRCNKPVTICEVSNCDGSDVYKRAKNQALNANTTLMTSALLGMLSDDIERRDLLIVDEAHGIEGYTANLLAGFSTTSLPEDLYPDCNIPKSKATHHGDPYDIVQNLNSLAKRFIGRHSENEDMSKEVNDCKNFVLKSTRFINEANKGYVWAINVFNKNNKTHFTLKPVDVSPYLRDNIWCKGKKIVLSTATFPGMKWIKRIGLDPQDTKVVSMESPFPKENRTVHCSEIIGKMSNGREHGHWEDIMATLNKIANRHNNKKGLVHTVSYDRAKRIKRCSEKYNGLKDNVVVDNSESARKDWQSGKYDILLSPKATEGLDLYGDMCRWQVLVKVPYMSPGDSWVSWRLNKKHQWDWYYQSAATSIIQSVGRAVRSPTDWAEFYIFDECFKDVQDRANIPKWFTQAIA